MLSNLQRQQHQTGKKPGKSQIALAIG